MKKKMQLSNGMSFLGPVRIGMTILLLIFIIFLQLGDRVSAAAIEDVEAAVIASIPWILWKKVQTGCLKVLRP